MRFDCLEMGEHLTLVVSRPSRIDPAIADRGFERRRFPEIDGIDRLHVVVPIAEYRRGGRCFQPSAVHDWIPRCLDQPDSL
jgi:hypothetical protein